MKKLLAMIMVVCMVAAIVPVTFATEVETTQSFDKSQFTKTVEGPKLYHVDNNGNKVAAGGVVRASTKTDMSDVAATKEKVSTKAATKGFADSPHYGVGMIDPSESLSLGVSFENVDFNAANDFYVDKSKSYSLLISPAEGDVYSSAELENTKIRKFQKNDKFWFNFDIVKGCDASGAPIYFTDKDGNKALIPYQIFMYSGTAAEWNSEVGVTSLKLCAAWDGYTKISQSITVPAANMVYVFAVVVSDATVQDMGIRDFQGYFQISEHEKDYKELKAEETIEVGKQ